VSNMGRSSILYSLIFLYLFALLLRLLGVDWGGVNLDESPGGAAKVLTGELTDAIGFYPPLLNYLIACAYLLYYCVGRMIGWWASSSEFRAAYFADKMQFFVVGRVVIAVFSATAAPLTFLLAIEQGIKRHIALVLAAIVALLPASIYWAHIAKVDSALGPAFLFVILTGFRFYCEPNRPTRQIALGVAIAIALSFKHSAVFFVVPSLLILFLASLFGQQNRVYFVIRAWVLVALATVLVWIPLNIGILLNPRPFLDAQVLQSQISLRKSGLGESIAAWFATMTSNQAGVPLLVLMAWACIPITYLIGWRKSEAKFRILTMWASTLIALIIIIKLTGVRETPTPRTEVSRRESVGRKPSRRRSQTPRSGSGRVDTEPIRTLSRDRRPCSGRQLGKSLASQRSNELRSCGRRCIRRRNGYCVRSSEAFRLREDRTLCPHRI
jgi:hypothetical protein